MSLVPKQWYADVNANEHNNYVEIFARNSGLVASWPRGLVASWPGCWLCSKSTRLIPC